MKHTLAIIMILLFSNLTSAQNPDYKDLWDKVEQFEVEGLPKSALKIVEDINKQVKKDKNHPQLIKTMLFKSKFALVLEEDAQLKIINDFKSEIEASEFPTKNVLENILAKFSRGELDMLVGTQMLAKGHDFPNVTLVGVISVDTGLSMPDFRASERTFQLITQVAGRAGRGELPGKVLIQTYYPEHYALRYSKKQDYQAFYDREIMFREKYHFPPFVSLASILIKHPTNTYAFDNANIFRKALDSADSSKQCIIMGPAPAALPRLKGEYRLQILIKSRNRKVLRELLDKASIKAEQLSCDTKIIYVEIDPVNML